jgi:hypothetical protein
MECNFNKDLLHEYLDQELEPLLAIILEEHLAVCSECRKELNQLKVLDWDLRFANHFEIPEDELKELRSRTLDICFDTEEKDDNWLFDLYKIQTYALSYAVNYVKYIPGTSLLKKTGLASGRMLSKKLLPTRR